MFSSIVILEKYIIGQAQLGYTDFNPGPLSNDIILVTFPKSGSTWTSYLLHQIRSECDDSFSDIKDVVIDITPGHWSPDLNPFNITQEYSPRIFKTHGSYKLCPKGCKYIYISRDPKDIFWSLYNFLHDLFNLDELIPLEIFFDKIFVDRFGTDHDIGNIWNHILSWYPHLDADYMLWLHYEDLIRDLPACIIKIANHMNIDCSDAQLDLILNNSKMSHMKTIENKINPSRDNLVGKVVLGFGPEMSGYASNLKFGKMRKGIIGDSKENLDHYIIDKLENEWDKRITPILGFKNYDEMLKSCSALNV